MMFDLGAFGPAVAALLQAAPTNELGPGKPLTAARAKLAALDAASITAPHTVRHPDMASACLAGLWLRFDFLDESHRISQELETPTGAYWHGLMHRREGDFGNAKYWFRRVGEHPVFESLCAAARQVAGAHPPPAARFLVEPARWDPAKFVDLCEQAIGPAKQLRPLAVEVQRREWELLFEYCYRQAIED